MINRLPKQYTLDQPGVPARRTAAGAEAPQASHGVAARLLNAAANSVGSRPVVSLGVAFAAGLLLGKLVKR